MCFCPLDCVQLAWNLMPGKLQGEKKATSARSENAFLKFFVCHHTFDLPISWQISAKGSEIRQTTDVYRCLAIDGRDSGQETQELQVEHSCSSLVIPKPFVTRVSGERQAEGQMPKWGKLLRWHHCGLEPLCLGSSWSLTSRSMSVSMQPLLYSNGPVKVNQINDCLILKYLMA